MVTKLNLINKALLSVGEREVPSSNTSSVSRLAANIVEEALVELQHEAMWNFRKTRVTATDPKVTASVNGTDYTISDLYDLTTVLYGYTPFELTYYQPDRAYNANRALGYTVLEDNSIRVFEGHSADKLTFVYVRTITIPSADSEEVDLPAEFEALILKKVRAMLSIQHLDDLGSYQVHIQDYERSKSLLMVNDYKAPGRSQTLYRNNRRRLNTRRYR